MGVSKVWAAVRERLRDELGWIRTQPWLDELELRSCEPSGALIGTARYASPEQARGETIDGRGDVYSLALVLPIAVVATIGSPQAIASTMVSGRPSVKDGRTKMSAWLKISASSEC